MNGQLIKKLHLKHSVEQGIRWVTEFMDISSRAGKTVRLEIRRMPGEIGRNCPECYGTCDNEAIAVAQI